MKRDQQLFLKKVVERKSEIAKITEKNEQKIKSLKFQNESEKVENKK